MKSIENEYTWYWDKQGNAKKVYPPINEKLEEVIEVKRSYNKIPDNIGQYIVKKQKNG